MNSAGLRLRLVVVLAAVTAVPAQAQTGLPDGWSLLARHVEAQGGKDAIARQTGFHSKGRVEVPAQGIGGDIEIYAAAPNRVFVLTTIPGIGAIRSGYDGEVGWLIHPALGPMVLEGRMLDQLKQQADLHATLRPETYFSAAETVADTTFDGRRCYKVKLATKWGEEYFDFFDAATGLRAGSVRKQASPMGDLETITVLSDYREFGGVLSPMKSVQRMMSIEQVLTVSDVRVGAVPDSVFALPVEIKALAGARKP